MSRVRGLQWVSVLTVLVGMLLGTGLGNAWASHGNYCGGEGITHTGLPIDLSEWCKYKYGSNATAGVVRQDAYGWVCRVPTKQDVGINVHDACHRTYGDQSLATLVGIGPGDWRCLRPTQVPRTLIPVLLLPANKVKASEVASVAQALRRIEDLVNGARHFYRTFTYVYISPSNAFVLPTATSASEWRALAPTAEGTGWSQGAYHMRVLQELDRGGWDKFKPTSIARIGAFVALGTPTPDLQDQLPQYQLPVVPLIKPRSFLSPSSAWAMGRSGPLAPDPYSLPVVFSLPLSASDAACTPGNPNVSNLPAYETAFFQTGNRLGVSLGLPRTDQYPFGGLLLRPDNYQQSIMFTGYGTKSVLFPFEAATLYNIWGSLP